MEQKEKIIIFASLFHDIGKFQQRITKERIPHSKLGSDLVDELKEPLLKLLGSETAFDSCKLLITDHHNKSQNNELLNILKEADHLSASERVDFDDEDNWHEKWSHKYLTSLFSKIYLSDDDKSNRKIKYYDQKLLDKKNYKIIIPQFETEKNVKDSNVGFPENTFIDFKEDLKSVLGLYSEEEDFTTVVNYILTVFEKYMWCIPDFTGSENTDISLYNHTKDVAGLAHAVLNSNSAESDNLNLIVGELPGIQKYIFNVANKWPAKILRGRSIYVQILTRQFASIILNKFGLTDASLIMHAGGKFYIIAPATNDFEKNFNAAGEQIEKILKENFQYELSFSSIAHRFNYNDLKNKKITFGDIIDLASYKLLQKRNQKFENIFFEGNELDEDLFIISDNYIDPSDKSNSNSIKCAVTDKPILKGRIKEKIYADNHAQIDKQIYNELEIGEKVPKNNVIVVFDNNYEEVIAVKPISDYKPDPSKNYNKIIINPDLDELLKKENINKDVLRNAQVLEVANYSTTSEKNKNTIMDFEDIEKNSNGAKFLTLIKGDVDNLGLIMSSGLVDDKKDITGISRTTTLSNHLKYFFSSSLNGFLRDWEGGKVEKDIDDNFVEDQKVYTVFAGGDDIMIITPQSSALKLVSALNNTFKEFVCENAEVHISYSLTNFKHNTPIRIVDSIAEKNQILSKSKFKSDHIINEESLKQDAFKEENDKAATSVFNTCIKNELINKLIEHKIKIVEWEKDNKISQGILRNLLFFSNLINKYHEEHDARHLLWHPKLTYLLNRTIKNKDGTYKHQEVESFFESILKINKQNDLNAILLEQILYPLVCEVIYGTRNKSEK